MKHIIQTVTILRHLPNYSIEVNLGKYLSFEKVKILEKKCRGAPASIPGAGCLYSRRAAKAQRFLNVVTSTLRFKRKVSQIILLTQFNSVMPENIVSSHDMKEEVRDHMMKGIFFSC